MVPMTLFSLLFLCLFHCSSLSPLYGLQSPAFCVWHLSFFTLHSFLGQTGGPEMGFPDPALLLLVSNGHFLLLMAHRYCKLNYVYNQTSHPHLSFPLISTFPLFPSVISALTCQPTYTLKQVMIPSWVFSDLSLSSIFRLTPFGWFYSWTTSWVILTSMPTPLFLIQALNSSSINGHNGLLTGLPASNLTLSYHTPYDFPGYFPRR